MDLSAMLSQTLPNLFDTQANKPKVDANGKPIPGPNVADAMGVAGNGLMSLTQNPKLVEQLAAMGPPPNVPQAMPVPNVGQDIAGNYQMALARKAPLMKQTRGEAMTGGVGGALAGAGGY